MSKEFKPRKGQKFFYVTETVGDDGLPDLRIAQGKFDPEKHKSLTCYKTEQEAITGLGYDGT